MTRSTEVVDIGITVTEGSDIQVAPLRT